MTPVAIIVQVSAAVLLGGALARCFRRTRAAARSAIWQGVFLTILLIPAVQWFGGPWLASAVPDGVLPAGISSQVPLAGAVATELSAQAPGTGWVEAGLMLWLVVALLLLLRLGWGLAQVLGISRRGRSVTEAHVLAEAAEARSQMGVHRDVVLHWSDEIDSPATFGTLRPVILLPAPAARWQPEHRRSVLLHEFAHVKRGDALTLLVASVLAAVHWFNPLVRSALSAFRAEQENACDDEVLRSGIHPADYVLHLVASARSGRRDLHLHAVAATLGRCDLPNRAAGLLSRGRAAQAAKPSAAALAVACYLFVAVPVTLAVAAESGTSLHRPAGNPAAALQADPGQSMPEPAGPESGPSLPPPADPVTMPTIAPPAPSGPAPAAPQQRPLLLGEPAPTQGVTAPAAATPLPEIDSAPGGPAAVRLVPFVLPLRKSDSAGSAAAAPSAAGSPMQTRDSM